MAQEHRCRYDPGEWTLYFNCLTREGTLGSELVWGLELSGRVFANREPSRAWVGLLSDRNTHTV